MTLTESDVEQVALEWLGSLRLRDCRWPQRKWCSGLPQYGWLAAVPALAESSGPLTLFP